MRYSLNKVVFNVFVFIWVLLILLLRPSIVGSYYNKEVFVLLVIVSVVIIYFSKNHERKLNLNQLVLYSLFTFVFIYFLTQGLILSSSISTVLNSSVLIIGIVLVLLFMTTDAIQKKFVQYFVLIHLILAVSVVITWFLSLITGFDNLTIYSFDVIGYATQRHVMFPFSIFWSKFNFLGLSFPRYTAFYKEPGLAQAFMLTAFWFSVLSKSSRTTRLILLFGSIVTFSTAGLLNIALSSIVYFFTRKGAITKYLLKHPVLTLMGLIIIITTSVISYQQVEKKKHEDTGMSRLESYERSIHLLHENPLFGNGYYSIRNEAGERVGTTHSLGLIGAAFQIGYLGVILYLAIWIYSFFVLNNGKYLYLYIPFFVTILLFQPDFNSSIIFVLLSLQFSKITRNKSQNTIT